MNMLIGRRLIVGGLGLVGVGLAERYAQAAPTEFHVGYQKAGLLSVAKGRGVFERRLKSLGVEEVKWSEFEVGLPMYGLDQCRRCHRLRVGWRCARHYCAVSRRQVRLCGMPASQHGLLVVEGSAIRALADIKDKKIAFARRSRAQSILLRLLAKAGLPYGDIVPVYLSPTDASAALLRGEVDAWVIWDPFFALAERRQNVRAIATTKDIVNGNSVYAANPGFAAHYPKVLAAVVDEVTKLTEWAAQKRDKFSEVTSTATRIELDVVRISVGRTDLLVGPVTPTVIAQLQETADAFLKAGVISKHPRPSQITVPRGLGKPEHLWFVCRSKDRASHRRGNDTIQPTRHTSSVTRTAAIRSSSSNRSRRIQSTGTTG